MALYDFLDGPPAPLKSQLMEKVNHHNWTKQINFSMGPSVKFVFFRQPSLTDKFVFYHFWNIRPSNTYIIRVWRLQIHTILHLVKLKVIGVKHKVVCHFKKILLASCFPFESEDRYIWDGLDRVFDKIYGTFCFRNREPLQHIW